VSGYDVATVRRDIPGLRRQVNGRTITYLDSGATSLPPRSVIEAMSRYYETHHANVHRGVYRTAEEATADYEGARLAVGRFIVAPRPEDSIVFTRGTTESFNLLAKSWGAANLTDGDAIVVTEMEHHANLVPWFQLAETIKLDIRVLKVTDDFRLDLANLDELLHGAKLLTFTAMSNVLGTINPVAELTARAHAAGTRVAVDLAQAVPHMPVDLTAWDVDFAAFSGHKMLGPTGIGVFFAKPELLAAMPPFLGGGGMIADVRLDGYTPATGVTRFEAGTPPIAEAVGLAAAVQYLSHLGMDNIRLHEQHLTSYALDALHRRFNGRVRVIGPANDFERGGVLSLDVDGVHPHDVAQILDQHGVCVRPGHHCAKPLMKRFGLAATARASFGPYTTTGDIDVLLDGLAAGLELLGDTQ
jgi:cysteine desulfurase/selenocysteine lyase